jgi:hypothetical protein
MSWRAQNRSKDAKTPSEGLAMSKKPEPDRCPIQPYDKRKRKRDPRVDQQRSDGVHETTNDNKRRRRDRRVLQQQKRPTKAVASEEADVTVVGRTFPIPSVSNLPRIRKKSSVSNSWFRTPAPTPTPRSWTCCRTRGLGLRTWV